MKELKTEADYGISKRQLYAEVGRGTAELLKVSLSCAVPLWIERARRYTDAEFKKRVELAGQKVAERGDIIQFRSRRAGQSAEAFNALAEGLALLAFCPGGVYFLGMHFEANKRKGEARNAKAYA